MWLDHNFQSQTWRLLGYELNDSLSSSAPSLMDLRRIKESFEKRGEVLVLELAVAEIMFWYL